jgi:hypothetical protein
MHKRWIPPGYTFAALFYTTKQIAVSRHSHRSLDICLVHLGGGYSPLDIRIYCVPTLRWVTLQIQ